MATSLLLVSSSSCGKTNYSKIDLYSKPTENVPIINIQGCDFDPTSKEFPKSLNFRFSELYSDVKYIKLEDTEGSALGNIDEISRTKNGDYIVFDLANGKIVRFDASGKFLNTIGNVGNAKNEFVRPIAVKYDPYNNQIAVYDNPKLRIMFFDLEGKFIDQIKFETAFSSFGIIDKDLIVIYLREVGNCADPDQALDFQIFNRQGERVKAYQPFEKIHNVRTAANTFSTQNDRIICNEQYSPLIFTFKGTELVPLYFMNFGEQQIPKSVVDEAKDFMELRRGWLKENKNWNFCMAFYENQDKYILRLSKKNRPLHYIADKKNPDNYIVKAFAFNDLYGKVDINYFDFSYDDKIVYFLDSEKVKKALDAIEKDRAQYEQDRAPISDEDMALLKDLSQHTNPILQICTLK